MKVKKEFKNGYFIFISIGTFFLLMEMLNLSHLFYLRLFNIVFVVYAVNNTLLSRITSGKIDFAANIKAALTTCFVGVFLSVIGLMIYSYMRGGEDYIHTLSKSFLFGGHPSINEYCISLFFEGIASSVLVTLFLVLYHNNKFAID